MRNLTAKNTNHTKRIGCAFLTGWWQRGALQGIVLAVVSDVSCNFVVIAKNDKVHVSAFDEK